MIFSYFNIAMANQLGSDVPAHQHNLARAYAAHIRKKYDFFFYSILYIPSTIFQLYRDRSSWVEPVLS